MPKGNNKDTSSKLLINYFEHTSVSSVDFEQVNAHLRVICVCAEAL